MTTNDPYAPQNDEGQQNAQNRNGAQQYGDQNPYGAPSAGSSEAPQSPYSAAPAPGTQGTDQQPYGGQQDSSQPYGAQQGQSYGGQQSHSYGDQQSQPYGAHPHQQYAGAQGGASFADASWSDTPPPNTKGVSTKPMTGEPMTDSDIKLWAMLAQLSVVGGYFFAVLGWVGPLVIYLMYKDRNRFVRFHASEALNGAIAVFILSAVLAIVTTIIAIVTFGIGSFLIPLAGVPAIVQIVFAIIGALKANNREWWAYPINIRFFS